MLLLMYMKKTFQVILSLNNKTFLMRFSYRSGFNKAPQNETGIRKLSLIGSCGKFWCRCWNPLQLNKKAREAMKIHDFVL